MIRLPDEAAARSVVALAGADGGQPVVPHVVGDDEGFTVEFTYPDPRPGAAYEDRVAALTRLARQHGGRYVQDGD